MAEYKLLSWNVNGLRSALKKGFWEQVEAFNPDVVCVQESKIDPTAVAENPALFQREGYQWCWHSAISRKGYSGVMTWSKLPIISTELSLGQEEFDREGRLIHTRFVDFSLLNVYFPNGGQGPERVRFKLDFYQRCLEYLEELRQNGEQNLVICGDFNTAHQEIDLHDPKGNQKTSGFLPEERACLDRLIEHGYLDTFRHFHPQQREIYTWWDLRTRSRGRNRGWRLDYFFVSSELKPHLASAEILPEVPGSDHCPVELLLRF